MKKIKLSIILLFTTLLVSCQLLPENTQLRTYRVLVQQGNVIEENKVDSLRINMTKEQIIFLLGEPVVNNIFNKNRWDYVYYRKRDPEETRLNMVSIFFKNDLVVSMKRITKNNDGLFEITNKNKNLPEFSNENKITAIESTVFDDIKLQGTSNKEVNIETKNQELNDSASINSNEIKKEISKQVKQSENQSTRNIEKNTASLEKYEVSLRKNDYDIVKTIIYEWKDSWENKDTNQYFSYYTEGYSSEYFDDQELWRKDRFKRINNNSNINIEIEDLQIEFNFDIDEIAYATFKQKYRSNEYSDAINKKIILIKKNTDWKIISEEVIDGAY